MTTDNSTAIVEAFEQTTPKYAVVKNVHEGGVFFETVGGIQGIARALHDELFEELPETAAYLVLALYQLATLLDDATHGVPMEIDDKVKQALSGPTQTGNGQGAET